MLALNLALLVVAVAASVWWAINYEEDGNRRVSPDFRRRSRRVSLFVAAATVAWAVANLIVYSGWVN